MNKFVLVPVAMGLTVLCLGTLVWTSMHSRKRIPANEDVDQLISASKVFFEKQEHVLLDLPQQFLRGDLKEWREWATENKMPYLSFRSSQNSQHRTIFFDQGKEYDRWFLAVARINDIEQSNGSFRRMEDKDHAKLLAVIVMDKRLAVPQIFFREYEIKDGHSEPAEYPEACYSCHTSGVREIRGVAELESALIPGLDPANLTSKALGAKRLSDFNKQLSSYGLPDWHGSYEPEKWYPALGKNSTSKFSCYQCHDGSDRGVLTPLSNREELLRKVLDEASMPPKFKGKKSERQKLYNSLAGDSYKKSIEEWLKSRPKDKYNREEQKYFWGDVEGEPNE